MAKARRLYLDQVTLTAAEAYDMELVDHVASSDTLDEDSLAVAERFAAYEPIAIRSFTKSADLLNLDLVTYLEQAGTGFETVPPLPSNINLVKL